MYALFVLVIVLVVVVVVFALGMLLERRRRRRIDDLVVAIRGKLIDVRPPPDLSTRRRIVRYIGPEGELRQATAVFGRAPHIEDDKPFQEVLRQTYKPPADPSSPVDINRIMRSIENAKLPGHAAFCAVVRQLAEGLNGTIIIGESASNEPVDRRFAPVLQCIEACHIDNGSPAEHVTRRRRVCFSTREIGRWLGQRRRYTCAKAHPTLRPVNYSFHSFPCHSCSSG